MTQMTKGEKTRARVIREARELIIAQGFKNTTINEIIAATGVKKGALYFHFANKDELGFSILEDAKEEFIRFLRDSLQGNTPLDRIDNSFKAILAQQKNSNFVGGCLFGNTALEMSDSDTRFAGLIRSVFQEWIDMISELLREAAVDGQLGKDIDPEIFAKTAVACVEGGIMLARVSKNPSDLEDCITMLRRLAQA